jgi:hypothetical protein
MALRFEPSSRSDLAERYLNPNQLGVSLEMDVIVIDVLGRDS